MSALAMILTVAMVVPADRSEKVSGEMREEQQPLNLKGSWKAILYREGQVRKGEAAVKDGKFIVRLPVIPGAWEVLFFGEAVDEGNNKLRMGRNLGIYKQDGDRLRICIGTPKERPAFFQAGKGQYLIELHRMRSSK